jgi:hypothetical protein
LNTYDTVGRGGAVGRYLIAIAAFTLLTGCSARTYEASAPAEVLDEIRAIAAVARSERDAERLAVCVHRVVAGDDGFSALRSVDLAEVQKHFNAARMGKAPLTQPTPPDLVLDDATLKQAIDAPVLGPACTGAVFFEFSRVQFLGDDAVVLGIKQVVPVCGHSPVLFKLKRRGGSWKVEETKRTAPAHGIVCDGIKTETRPRYFSIER